MRRILLIVAVVAMFFRLILFLSNHLGEHHATVFPHWPVHVGDTFHFRPGDTAISVWDANPDNDGLLVRQMERDGIPLPGVKVCALELGYMVDPAQPGGDLTLLSKNNLGIWRARWTGGDTMPTDVKDSANCGRNAVIEVSNWQLHSLINIENLLPAPPHEGPLDEAIIPGAPVTVPVQ